MVVFTCNHCGDSLTKKKVELHGFRCRPLNLTCVDCLKDFRDDYTKHMVCISEKDRYSATGLNGQPAKKNKQQRWLEAARDSCSKAIDDGIPGITDGILKLLKYLLDVPHIPDKNKQFTNFIKSSRRAEPDQNITFVWNILEKARLDLAAQVMAEFEAANAEAMKKKAEQMKTKKQDSSDSSSSDSDSEDDKKSEPPKNGIENNEGPSQVVQSKSEKKKKRMMSESESVINGASEVRMPKKSKKNPKTEESEDSSNLNSALDACHLNGVVEEKLSKKERKEKKKREKYEAQLMSLETVKPETEPQDEPMDEVVEEAETKKDKKKKKKKKKAELKNNSESAEDEPMEEVVEEAETKKGKKKKNKNNSEEVVLVEEVSDSKGKKKEKKSKKQQRLDEAEQIYSEKPDKKGKTAKPENGKLNDTLKLDEDNGTEFSWDTAILQVLESQSDHEVSMKKLSKKVLNEYLLSVGDDAHVDEAKIINKFHKKLQKMHNVLVHKDKVRLKTSRD